MVEQRLTELDKTVSSNSRNCVNQLKTARSDRVNHLTGPV